MGREILGSVIEVEALPAPRGQTSSRTPPLVPDHHLESALGEQLESRKVIDRAKGLLMDELSMSETDAFGFIQRTAMSERTRMRDVADRILDGSLRPSGD